MSVAYPKVGDHNPQVRIGVVDVATGQTRMLDLGETGEFLVPRVYWTAAQDTLAVMTMNRAQNGLRVQLFDVGTGARRLLFEETSAKGWIDVFDFFAGVQDYL